MRHLAATIAVSIAVAAITLLTAAAALADPMMHYHG
jgi:hypothetical protein